MSEEANNNQQVQQTQQESHTHHGYWKSKDYGDVEITKMSTTYLQKAYYRSLGKVEHHDRELKKQQDLSQFWHEKSEELEEELKKRNESLGTFLGMNIKGEKDDEHQ
jgi:predicted transcriptional regulator